MPNINVYLRLLQSLPERVPCAEGEDEAAGSRTAALRRTGNRWGHTWARD